MLPTSRRLLARRLPSLAGRTAASPLRAFTSTARSGASANDQFANGNNAFYAEEMYREFKQVSSTPQESIWMGWEQLDGV